VGDVIERIVNADDDVRFAHARAHARAPLAVKVKYTTPEGKQFDSLTGGIGGGGLFIESSQPLAPGTELAVEFALPDRPWEKHKAKAKVAWTRNKPERFLLFPGMGIQFTEIDDKSRHDLVELVSRAQSFTRNALSSASIHRRTPDPFPSRAPSVAADAYPVRSTRQDDTRLQRGQQAEES
jgi:uncharacterized protein (TIGR02266 family)